MSGAMATVAVAAEEEQQKENAEITFWEDPNHLFFESENRRLVTRKLSGSFPNYEMFIPKDNDKFVTYDSTELFAAINRVSFMSDERTNAIMLTLRPPNQIMTVSARSAEEGEAQETVAVEDAGAEAEEFAIKFQFGYVKDFINSLKDDAEGRISMSFKDANAQTLFRPANDDGKRFLGVIMPLRH